MVDLSYLFMILLEKISESAAKQVSTMPVEQADFAVKCRLLEEELLTLGLTEYKIKKVYRKILYVTENKIHEIEFLCSKILM